MKANVNFYRCNLCGNLVGLIKNGGGQMICCQKPMEKLVPNTTDASVEKHVPVVTHQDGKLIVNVGSVPHPMTQEHQIEWIAVVTENGTHRLSLAPGDAPVAEFSDIKACEVFAYCNLHGLWKA